MSINDCLVFIDLIVFKKRILEVLQKLERCDDHCKTQIMPNENYVDKIEKYVKKPQ